MIRAEAWPDEIATINVVRMFSVDDGHEATSVSCRDLARWLGTGPNKAKAVLKRLVDLRVLKMTERRGRLAWEYRLTDPRTWLDVPWVVPGRGCDGRTAPELVWRRIEWACLDAQTTVRHVARDFHTGESRATVISARRPAMPIARKDSLRAIPLPDDRAQVEGLRAMPGEEIARNAPSSSGGAPGRASTPSRDREEEEEPRGSIELTGGARAVAAAILSLGKGGLADSLRRQLASAFAGKSADDVAHIVQALPGHADGPHGLRAPKLVSTAVDMLHLVEAPPAPDADPYSIGDLVELRDEYLDSAAAAYREGNEEMGAMFERKAAECDDRVAAKRARRTA